MKKRNLIYLIYICLLPGFFIACKSLPIPFVSKKKEVKEEPKLGNYEKLFKDKTVVTTKNDFVTAHKIDGKLYFEMPRDILGREMLLAVTPDRTDDNTVSTIGLKQAPPLHIRFVLSDSVVYMQEVNTLLSGDIQDRRVRSILQNGYADPIKETYSVKAYNADSSAVVFDVTSLFLGNMKDLSPMGSHPPYDLTASIQSKFSLLNDVKAYENSVTVKSSLQYSVTVFYFIFVKMGGVPISVDATHTLMLLPKEQQMKPRYSDLRIGTALTEKKLLPADGKAIKEVSYANKWDIYPRDIDAYKRGEGSEPKKQIIMYMDNYFPSLWREPIKRGIEKWNKAFEQIGLKNVIEVRGFPTDDPSFDPGNIKYSCIRFSPSTFTSSDAGIWVNPKNGEILNSSIIFHQNLLSQINNWRFSQTAQIDERVRTTKMPDIVIEESLEYLAAKEMGRVLGLIPNMGASSAYPVDSLRSASFTQKYGISPSIMDDVRFNYVAQPEDKGVKLTPDLGAYDYYAIKWLYTPIVDLLSEKEENEFLDKIITERKGDSTCFYGKEQSKIIFDPRSLPDDLGDDATKAGEYGIKNIRYQIENLPSWINADNDPEGSHRSRITFAILKQYQTYMMNAMSNIGGFYLADNKGTKNENAFVPVPRDKQRNAMEWIMKHLRDDEWLDNREIYTKSSLNMPSSTKMKRAVLNDLYKKIERIALCESLSDNPYSMEDFFNDLYEGVWKSTIDNKPLTYSDKLLQDLFFSKSAPAISTVGGTRFFRDDSPSVLQMWVYNMDKTGEMDNYIDRLYDLEEEKGSEYIANLTLSSEESSAGYGWQKDITVKMLDNSNIYFLDMIRKLKILLDEKVKTGLPEDRAYYQGKLLSVNRILEEK